MALSHSEAQVLYARYLKSGMTLEKFCKLHQVPYWDFSDWINQWEKLYGARCFSMYVKFVSFCALIYKVYF